MQAGVDRNRAQKKRVFTPSAADRQPAAFHHWLRKHGGGAVPFEQNPDAAVGVPGGQMQRELLLDRCALNTDSKEHTVSGCHFSSAGMEGIPLHQTS